MKQDDVKRLLKDSLRPDSDPDVSRKLFAEVGNGFTFSPGFTDKVLDSIYNKSLVIDRQLEFVRSLNSVFYRVAFAGVAAILLLLISTFFMNESITFNELLGISDTFDENLITILAGQ